MKKILCLLSLISLLAISGQAMAYSIALNPVQQNIPLFGTATVNIVLTVGDTEFLEGFKLALAFDDTILLFDSLTSTTIDGNYLSGFDNTGTSVGLSGFLIGNAFSNGKLTLASLNFTGNAYGTSPLDLTGTVLNLGDTVETQLTPASGSVGVVPEPGTFLLLGAGLAGLVGYRKKFRKM